MNRMPRQINLLGLVLLVAVVIPVFFRSPYFLHVMILMGVWIILSLSLNFVTGFAGQLALGHAAFITIGAYAGALMMVNYGWSFWISLLIGGGSAFLSGLILGIMAMRLRGDYLGMITMGFGEIVRMLAINMVGVTRGPMGLPGIPKVSIFGYVFKSELAYYYLMIILIVLIFFSIERLVFSRFGRACMAIRDDETAAEAMGVVGYNYKILAFCISALFAGLVGVFYASWVTLLSPDSFQMVDSINLSAMITLGGIGSLYGPIFGGFGIGILPELLRPITTGMRVADLRMAGVGLIMIIFMLLRPTGLFGASIDHVYISLEPIYKLFERPKK
jgi:branched-chain amino acid transport system permease protein